MLRSIELYHVVRIQDVPIVVQSDTFFQAINIFLSQYFDFDK